MFFSILSEFLGAALRCIPVASQKLKSVFPVFSNVNEDENDKQGDFSGGSSISVAAEDEQQRQFGHSAALWSFLWRSSAGFTAEETLQVASLASVRNGSEAAMEAADAVGNPTGAKQANIPVSSVSREISEYLKH